MRKLLILGAILFSLAPVSWSHDVGLPACSKTQLWETVILFPNYHKLVEAGAGREARAEALVDYSEALIAWRDQLWERIPLCEEALHASELLDATASFLLITYAFELAGAPPFKDQFVERASAAQTEVDILNLASSRAPASGEMPAAYSLPACSDTDIDILTTILGGFFALQEIALRTETVKALAAYGETQAVWRDSMQSRLPVCKESFEAGLLMRHIASDLALELAFDFANLASGATVISQRVAADRAELDILTEAYADEARELVVAQGFATPLPACTEQEMIGYILIETTHPELLDSIASANTPAGLIDASRAHLAWREATDAQLPACAENFEIAWIVYRAVGAFFAGHALDLAGLPPADNEYVQLVTRLEERRSQKTSVITHAFADSVIESMNDEEKAEEVRAPERSFPSCESEKLGLGFFNALVEYSDLVDRVDSIATVRDVLSFFDAEMAWTEKYFAALPTCAEATEVALLMYRILADYSSSFALLVAGVEFANIPYLSVISSNEGLLADWLNDFAQ